MNTWIAAASVALMGGLLSPVQAQAQVYRGGYTGCLATARQGEICVGDSVRLLSTGDSGIVITIEPRSRAVEVRTARGTVVSAYAEDLQLMAGRRGRPLPPPAPLPRRPIPPMPQPPGRGYPGECMEDAGLLICEGDRVLLNRERRCEGYVDRVFPRTRTLNVEWVTCSGYGSNLSTYEITPISPRGGGTSYGCAIRRDSRSICVGDIVTYTPNGAIGTVISVDEYRNTATVSWNISGSGLGSNLNPELLAPARRY